MNDAIAKGLGVDDKVFLPCVRTKSVDRKEKDPRVLIEVDDGVMD